MACGYIAMLNAGLKIEKYDAFEIDKYAIKVATHNFPDIEEHGDVFNADFTEFSNYDFLIGGSPCTHWSIAQQPGRRETTASGLGWSLFQQYVRALIQSKPKFFIYENNKSMSDDIRKSITDTFGFEPICINSALVSAQSRRRLYWVGMRGSDGSYAKADIDQPDDLGIVLRDILAGNGRSLSQREMDYMVRDHADRRWNFCVKPGECDKSVTITANIHNGVPYNVCADPVKIFVLPREDGVQTQGQAFRVYNIDGKSVSLKSNVGGVGAKTGLYAIEDSAECNGAYEVRDGQINVNGRMYPIKLGDGVYRIRKLTVDECKKLQTVPEWYDMSCISETQAYKCLGNGWTCDVITHLIKACLNEDDAQV